MRLKKFHTLVVQLRQCVVIVVIDRPEGLAFGTVFAASDWSLSMGIPKESGGNTAARALATCLGIAPNDPVHGEVEIQ